MTTVSITVTDATLGTVTITDAFDTTQGPRFINWLTATYGKDGAGAVRTPAQTVQACWAGLRANILAQVQQREADAAAASARQGVAPVTTTTTVA